MIMILYSNVCVFGIINVQMCILLIQLDQQENLKLVSAVLTYCIARFLMGKTFVSFVV